MLVDKNEIITKEKTPVKAFSSHFINIVKNYHGTPTYPFCQITCSVKSYLLNRRVKSYLRLLIPKKPQVIKKKPP